MDAALSEFTGAVDSGLPEAARGFVDQAADRLASERERATTELFPQLRRRIGTDPLSVSGIHEFAGRVVDLAAWRACDAVALEILARDSEPPADDLLLDLFSHGDLEERTMVLRCLGALPVSGATARLIGEAQRTNTGTHFEAAVLDSNVVTRCHQAGELTLEELNGAVLKVAFLELPLARMHGVTGCANPELTRMLQDLATEREAATRSVWRDTNRLIAHAPAEGTLARIIGGLEHGDDEHRLAAAEALATLNRPDLLAFARERLQREPRSEIRDALNRALGQNPG